MAHGVGAGVPSRVEAFGIVVLEGWRAGAAGHRDGAGRPGGIPHPSARRLPRRSRARSTSSARALEDVLGDPAARGPPRRAGAAACRLHVAAAVDAYEQLYRGPPRSPAPAHAITARRRPGRTRSRLPTVPGRSTPDRHDLVLPAERQQDRRRLPGARDRERSSPTGDTTSYVQPCEPAVTAHGTATVPCPLTGSLRTFKFALGLREAGLSGFDVMHAHGDDYWLWRRRAPPCTCGRCTGRASRRRCTSAVRRSASDGRAGLSEAIATLVADRTVLVSPRTRRWMPWVRTVIPNGVDIGALRGTRIEVGAADGALRRHVDGSQARGAARRRLPARRPAGVPARGTPHGHPRRPRRSCRRASWRPRPADDDELVEEYGRAWVFCLPSTYEGFGIPYAEAMAAGLPVLATPNIGARFVTDEGRAGSSPSPARSAPSSPSCSPTTIAAPPSVPRESAGENVRPRPGRGRLRAHLPRAARFPPPGPPPHPWSPRRSGLLVPEVGRAPCRGSTRPRSRTRDTGVSGAPRTRPRLPRVHDARGADEDVDRVAPGPEHQVVDREESSCGTSGSSQVPTSRESHCTTVTPFASVTWHERSTADVAGPLGTGS